MQSSSDRQANAIRFMQAERLVRVIAPGIYQVQSERDPARSYVESRLRQVSEELIVR